MAEDHANARQLAFGLERIEGFTARGAVETNIVIADVQGSGRSAKAVAGEAAKHGVRVGVFGPATLRLVTHRDVSREQIEIALNVSGDKAIR